MTAATVVVLAAAVALAAWAWRRADTPTGFWAASRSAGAVLAGLGGTAAGLSAFVFVGGPGYFAAVGAASLWIVLSAPLTGALQCWAIGEPVVELVRRHRCLTVPDLLAVRFGEGWPRGLAAGGVIAGGIATLGVQVKGVAVVGEILLGVPGWQVAVVAVTATAIYTTAGGMRAGLLAEALQGAVMAGAALWIAGGTLARAGGPAAAARTVAAHRPDLLDAWGPAGPTTALGLFLLFALGTCAQPHYVQKFLFLRDREALRWMPLVMTVALAAVLTVWVGVGLGGTALWLDGDLELHAPDELTARVLGSAGGPLLAVAAVAVVAAVMSTAASLLNLVAAAVTRDLPRAVGRPPGEGLKAARVATVVAAAAAVAVGLGSERSVALLGVLGWGTFTAALLPSLVLGLSWQRASRRGAVAALVAGPAVQLALEWGRLAGWARPVWEPGLAGAAVGTLLLVGLSCVGSARSGGNATGQNRPVSVESG